MRWLEPKWMAPHTYIHSDLSLVLNITVRLALNPEVHAKRRGSKVPPDSLGPEKKGELRASRAPLKRSILFFPPPWLR